MPRFKGDRLDAEPVAGAVGLTRSDLSTGTKRVLDPGGRAKASVSVFEDGTARLLVIKDLAPMIPWIRWSYGAWLQSRERRILQRLKDLDGVPTYRGRVDRWAFAMDHFDGRHFDRAMGEEFCAGAIQNLGGTIRGLHSLGVIHLDLREKKNVLVSKDGHVAVIDFETSLSVGGLGFLGRVLVRMLGTLDHSAIVKFKGRFAPSYLDPGEARRFARSSWRRRLWLPKLISTAVKELWRWLFGRKKRNM